MKKLTEDKVEDVAVAIITIFCIPAIVVFSLTAFIIGEYIMDDEDRYQIGKKW